MIFALVGNPNCGKTTVFNKLTHSLLYVGNRPGVTVETSRAKIYGSEDFLIDLPGTYSLCPYTEDEQITCDFLKNSPPDCIVNVVDSTSLERNLYLTSLLADLKIPMIIFLSMEDILLKNGGKLNETDLSHMFKCPVTSNLETVTELASVTARRHFLPTSLSQKTTDARYAYISREIERFYIPPMPNSFTYNADKILTGKFTGIPIFLAIITFIYYISISLVGTTVSEIASNMILPKIKEYTLGISVIFGVSPILRSLITEGIIDGIGSVLCFIPQLTVLFLLLVFLEDCGYMSRVAFITDRILRNFGLSGKCFIPMFIASGCSAPAILTSKTLENKTERRICAATLSFIPCSAKLPVIVTIGQTAVGGAWWFAPLMYVIGFTAIALNSIFSKKISVFHQKCQNTTFITELPTYKLPSCKNIILHTSNRLGGFIKKAGSVLLLASLALWFLKSFELVGRRLCFTAVADASLLASFGKKTAFLFSPTGFGNWRAAIAVFSGFIAKESIISTILLLGSFESVFTSKASLCSFLVFNLLNPPCVAAMSAMHTILGKKYFIAALLYQICFSYTTAWLLFNIMTLLTTFT